MPANSLMCEPPRPLMPATATRMVSLAPRTLPDDFVPAMTKAGVNALAAVGLGGNGGGKVETWRKPRELVGS